MLTAKTDVGDRVTGLGLGADDYVPKPNKEFALLVALMREPRRVFSKEELLSQVWGEDFDGEVGNVETYISYLRAKVDTDPAQRLIHTIRGAGYSLRSES